MQYKYSIFSSLSLMLLLSGCADDNVKTNSNQEQINKNNNSDSNKTNENLNKIDESKSKQMKKDESKVNDTKNKNSKDTESKNKDLDKVQKESEKVQSEVNSVINNMTDEQKEFAKNDETITNRYGAQIKKDKLIKSRLLTTDTEDFRFKVIEANYADEINNIKAGKNSVFIMISAEVKNLKNTDKDLMSKDNEYQLKINNKTYLINNVKPAKLNKNEFTMAQFIFEIPKSEINIRPKQFIIKSKDKSIQFDL